MYYVYFILKNLSVVYLIWINILIHLYVVELKENIVMQI